MSENHDDFVHQLQQQLHAETKEAYGEKVFNRWLEPKFFERLTNASSSARIKG